MFWFQLDDLHQELECCGLSLKGLESQELECRSLISKGLESQRLECRGLISKGLTSQELECRGLISKGLEFQLSACLTKALQSEEEKEAEETENRCSEEVTVVV